LRSSPGAEVLPRQRTSETGRLESRKRATVKDAKTGPKEPRSTVLTEADEAMVAAARRHTFLPLDDCL